MDSGLLRRGGALRLACGALAASTVTVLLTGASAQAAGLGDLGQADTGSPRVLQSVEVDLAPDGTLTNIDGTVVESTSDSVEDAESTDTEYAPDEVAGQLPVRVMTAWRTEDGAGTDLADLDGYDGTVRIDLTVQNLTVRPKTLQYDVDGESSEQAALVGSPLTVVAAADLGEAPSESVVTAGTLPAADVTNGVLGTGEQGETQVQWATILAPPQLGASARFTLVVDARNFQVPDLDISVQPGLVTDPSMGALVDSAFNPATSHELELQRRTIDLIGDVNGVLARASSTISDVRRILSGSAETLGQQTVADLQASTESVTTSMRTLNAALEDLDQEIGTTLAETESTALQELSDAVSTVDDMLGDTSRSAGTAGVVGDGCQLQVTRPQDGSSLFDSMLAVASQLNGYADANAVCRDSLVRTILTTIGPDEPSETACVDGLQESVSCSLLESKDVFVDVANELRTLSTDVTALLRPELYTSALGYSEQISVATDRVLALANALENGRLGVWQNLRDAIALLEGDVVPALTSVTTAADAIGAASAAATTNLQAAATARGAARAEACALRESVSDPAVETATDNVSAYLTGTDCAGAPMAPPADADGNPTVPASVATDAVATSLEEITGQSTQVRSSVQAARFALVGDAQKEGVLDLLHEALDIANLRKNNPDAPPTLGELIEELAAASDALDENGGLLADDVADLQSSYADLEQKISSTVDGKTADAIDFLNGAVDPQVEKVTRAGNTARTEIDESFTRSSMRMRDLADQLVTTGRTQIEDQKRKFNATEASASDRISSQIREGMARVSGGVNASTRDMEAASSLLVADLRRVLLDIGERRVNGGGLLGAMTTSAATARSADYQLALATGTTDAYANVRSRDVAGILLRQAQTDAAMQMLADMPAFELDLDAGTLHRTVYHYRIGDGQ